MLILIVYSKSHGIKHQIQHGNFASFFIMDHMGVVAASVAAAAASSYQMAS